MKDMRKVDHIHITAPPEMNDTEVLWNKEYVTLFVSIHDIIYTTKTGCTYTIGLINKYYIHTYNVIVHVASFSIKRKV